MKGIVFTEFMEHVEDALGLAMVDEMIQSTRPQSGGCYTSVGTYASDELMAYVKFLSDKTGHPASQLIEGFGMHLAKAFSKKFSDFFKNCQSTIDFLKTVDNHIHVEVRKLYPDADLPEFTYNETGETFTLVYKSKRNLADLAHGLILGCAQYYQDKLQITRRDEAKDDYFFCEFNVKVA